MSVFHDFLNGTNDTKLRKASHIVSYPNNDPKILSFNPFVPDVY